MKNYSSISKLTMIGLIGLILFVLLSVFFPSLVRAQSVSVFGGGAMKGTVMYGIEFRSPSYGFYVERYSSEGKGEFPKYVLPSNQTFRPQPMLILYDGIMIGVNKHIKSLSEITLSGGIGILNEYYIYNEGKGKKSVSNTQKFSFELGAGKDITISNHLVLGVKGGVNNLTSIFGNLTVGFKL